MKRRQRTRSAELLKTTPAITAKWHEFVKTRSASLRDELIRHFMGYAEQQAQIYYQRLPDHVDFDQVRSAAMIGLIGAVDAFDPARKIRFESYATLRVRGAILDDLRAMDWAPRLVRARATKLGRLVDRLTAELGRQPSRDELIEAAGVSAAAFDRMERDAAERQVCSIDAEEPVEDGSFETIIEQRREPQPDEVVANREAAAVCLAVLSPRKKRALSGIFFEGKTQRAIADEYGVIESNASQWKTAAIAIIRASDVGKELQAATAA